MFLKCAFKEIMTIFICSQYTSLIMCFKWFAAIFQLHDPEKKKKRKRGSNLFPSLNAPSREDNYNRGRETTAFVLASSHCLLSPLVSLVKLSLGHVKKLVSRESVKGGF